ncbi:MAG: zinc-ribbon domain-containing protein [Candidatus Pacebacteria bacterium]|nr:zinc-ribbon domain-containing protein [Candidatus Paceibacterota bacterium]
MGKKSKTHGEFIQELHLINPNIEVLDKYQGYKMQIKCRCRLDGYEWISTPSRLLRGSSCYRCKMKERTKTHEQFIKELKDINLNISVLTKYEGCKIKVKCKCLIDDYEWESSPDNLLRGKGCPKCAGNIIKTHDEFVSDIAKLHPNIEILDSYVNNKTHLRVKYKNDNIIFFATPNALYKKDVYNQDKLIKRTLTHDAFIDQLYIVNPNIKILGEYKNNYTKIKCKCLHDNFIWTVKPYFLLNGESTCPVCNGRRLTPDIFKEKFYKIHKNIKLLSEFMSHDTKVKCQCLIDNHVWYAMPSNLLQGKGCSKCRDRKKTKTNDEFLRELYNVNQYILPLDKYEKINKKIRFRCQICGHVWETTPSHTLRGSGCPKCKSSKGEKKISKYLKDRSIMSFSQYKFDDLLGVGGGYLSYDFYVPDNNLLIEYQGEFHDNSESVKNFQTEEDFIKQQEHDRKKRNYAKLHNIDLLEIWYYDFNNIEEILNRELNKYMIA